MTDIDKPTLHEFHTSHWHVAPFTLCSASLCCCCNMLHPHSLVLYPGIYTTMSTTACKPAHSCIFIYHIPRANIMSSVIHQDHLWIHALTISDTIPMSIKSPKCKYLTVRWATLILAPKYGWVRWAMLSHFTYRNWDIQLQIVIPWLLRQNPIQIKCKTMEEIILILYFTVLICLVYCSARCQISYVTLWPDS